MNEETDKVGGELHALLRQLTDMIEKSSGRIPFNQELLLALIKNLDEKLKTAMDAAEKAVSKAEAAADKRFEGLNELRNMTSNWRTEFARQSTVDLQIKGLSDHIDNIRSSIWAYLIGGVVTGAGIATALLQFLRHQ
jgi:hypothetical protein